MVAVPRTDTNFFHAHCHTQYSATDALSAIPPIVDKADRMNQRHLAFTDHGNMAATVKGYLECKKRNIGFYPGLEGYLIDPEYPDWENPKKGETVGRYHYGLLAVDEDGYKALVKFNSRCHTRPRFNRFARNSLADLINLGKEAGDSLVLTTGCYFGFVQQKIAHGQTDTAKRFVKMLSAVFPNLFVEVQHHNICHDDQPEEPGLLEMDDADIVNVLFDIAEELDLPVIATQDSHYLNHGHKTAHSLMKRMVYKGDSDEGFPGDSFHFASAEWVAEHYEQWQWDIIEDGFDELVALHDLRIEPLDNYRIHVPKVSDTPNEDLRTAVEDGLETYLDANPDLDPQPYWDRADMELEVIEALNMADYHLIWIDGVDWNHEADIGVEARGSANGSLVCFAVGITQTDPIKWGGMFERYISRDRTKPPDVDLDIEDAERMRFVRYLLAKYGAVQIGTWSMLGSNIDPETGEETGSILQTWLSSKRVECDKIAAQRVQKAAGRKAYSQAVFKRTYGDVQGIEDVRRHSEKDYLGLKQLIAMKSVYRSYGTHAGGVLLSGDDLKVEDYIPTMLVASSDTRVTQYDMDDVEAFGLLKMDVLGQASLRMMKLCQRNIDLSHHHEFEGDQYTDFSWIPLDDPAACKLLREGRTDTGIFHYEGYTKAKGGRELGIKSTEDAIMGQALFMPGAMDSGQKDLYIARRKSAAERKKVTYLSPEFEGPLKKTFGTVIFQEQVIDIMRNMGMDIEGINKFFKVVKDSGKGAVERNRERMAEVQAQFFALCDERGIDRDAAWQSTAGFVSYGFNRAHASGYGIRSYRTAFLKAHYPTEYMAALLETWAGRKKEKAYIKEARRQEVRLLPPDVNVSGVLWTQDYEKRNVVRKGLVSVPGLGIASALPIAAEAPFMDMEDLIERVPKITGGKPYLKDGTMIGTIAKLDDVGALDSLLEDRKGGI